jgi:hypothetical protein
VGCFLLFAQPGCRSSAAFMGNCKFRRYCNRTITLSVAPLWAE